jgi:hypothetical protein
MLRSGIATGFVRRLMRSSSCGGTEVMAAAGLADASERCIDVGHFSSIGRFRDRSASDTVKTGVAVVQRQSHYGSRPMPTFSGPSTTACILALGSTLAFSSMPAKAAENSFSIPPKATELQAGATAGTAINLPPVGVPSFFITFVLPRDYAKNQKFSVVLYLSGGNNPSCIVRIVTPQLNRMRRNEPISFDEVGLDEGNPNIKLTEDILGQKVVTVAPGEQLNGQRPGDAIRMQVRREGDDPIDTCNQAVFVQAIDVRYPID